MSKAERCHVCGKKVKVQIQKNSGYCSAQHEEIDALLGRYRELQRAEPLTLEADRAVSRAWGEAWRAYIKACKRAGVKPASADSPDLGHW